MLGTQPAFGVVAATDSRGRGPTRRPPGRRRRPAVEALESRRLPAVTLHNFPIPQPGSGPQAIAAGPDGALWFTEFSKIGRITTAGAITEFPTPGSGPQAIAAGPDGALWFTEFSKIGRITTAGAITEFPIPSAVSPQGIAAGPDGALWFTEGDKIGRITTAGVVTEFPLPTPGSEPEGIAAGPDGALWFTEYQGKKIGRITTVGAVTEFPIPSAGFPKAIATGPDGALWFTEGDKIGRITTAGAITEFSIPVLAKASGDNVFGGIAAGPDGNLWVTRSAIYYTPGPFRPMFFIVASSVERVSTAGSVTEFPLSSPYSLPVGIAAGPDGNLWFTEQNAGMIGQAVLSGPDAPRADLAITSTASPAPATAGLPLTYTLTVVNRGPDTAYGVTVTDALPAGAAFASAAATQGAAPTQAGGLVTAHLGNLAAGAAATVTIVVVPAAAGALVNAAGVATTSSDPEPANDTATVSTLVNPPPVLAADLAIAVSTSPAVARAGSPLTYTLTVFNRGPGVAPGVVVADALPAHALVAWASASQGGVPARVGGTLVARLGDLAPGARATVTLVVLTSAAGAFDSVAVVASGSVDPVPSDNAVVRRITVLPPESSHRPAIGTGAILPPSGPGAGPAARSVTPAAPAPAAGLAGRFLAPLRPATLPPWSAWGRGSRRAGWWGVPW